MGCIDVFQLNDINSILLSCRWDESKRLQISRTPFFLLKKMDVGRVASTHLFRTYSALNSLSLQMRCWDACICSEVQIMRGNHTAVPPNDPYHLTAQSVPRQLPVNVVQTGQVNRTGKSREWFQVALFVVIRASVSSVIFMFGISQYSSAPHWP